MSPTISTAVIEQQGKLVADVHNLKNSISDVRSDVKELTKEVWELKIKIAKYSVIAGILTTIVSRILEVGMSKILH
jgi:peptidoglycan hydrolase CwlO-like protein